MALKDKIPHNCLRDLTEAETAELLDYGMRCFVADIYKFSRHPAHRDICLPTETMEEAIATARRILRLRVAK